MSKITIMKMIKSKRKIKSMILGGVQWVGSCGYSVVWTVRKRVRDVAGDIGFDHATFS